MEISKLAVILAHEHQSDHKNITNDFRIHFLQCIHSRKNDCQWNARKCSIKEDFNHNGSLSIS